VPIEGTRGALKSDLGKSGKGTPACLENFRGSERHLDRVLGRGVVLDWSWIMTKLANIDRSIRPGPGAFGSGFGASGESLRAF
jgi:hypothetical protein